MASERVADMSVQQLRDFVEAIVDERIRSERPKPYKQSSQRPLSEVLEEMRQIIIIPKPGTPSVVELLREERDR